MRRDDIIFAEASPARVATVRMPPGALCTGGALSLSRVLLECSLPRYFEIMPILLGGGPLDAPEPIHARRLPI